MRPLKRRSLKRSLGAFQLTLLGIGAVIGTGIFVLTATAAQKAGPGMMISFMVAGPVCAVAALCYSELASMVPVAGSAYTYSYAVMGEMLAWLVGWALILEYALGASAVAVGWSGYHRRLARLIGIHVPHALRSGPQIQLGFLQGGEVGGFINLPAVLIVGLVTTLLVIGTKESATFNAVLVLIKVTALTLFLHHHPADDQRPHRELPPFRPARVGQSLSSSGTGVLGAAASIFFAYVGFDAVSTAAEETKNPQRNVPIGLIGSLLICTLFYLLVAAGVVGAYGAQPLLDPRLGMPFMEGSPELYGSSRRAMRPMHRRSARRKRSPTSFARSPPALRQPRRPCRRGRASFGRAADDVRPDAHLLRHGARRPAAGEAVAPFTRSSARPRSSPSSPASSWRSRRPSCRSARSPTIRTRARCLRLRRCRWA